MEEDLSFRPSRPDGSVGPDARISETGSESLRTLLEDARTVIVRLHRRIELSEKQYESLSRRVMALWVAVVMLAIGIGLLALYELRIQRPL